MKPKPRRKLSPENSGVPDGDVRRPLPDRREYQKSYYAANRARYLLRNRKRAARNMAIVDAFKAKGCADCGVADLDILELHHRDPAAKEQAIARMRCANVQKLEVELAKCDVLCANCHRKHHANERRKQT